MQIDNEVMRVIFSAVASSITTLFTIGGWFYGSINSLNKKITNLSSSIVQLDKNLAVQTAIFEQHFKQDCLSRDRIN